MPGAPCVVYTRPRQSRAADIGTDIAMAALFVPSEPGVTTSLAATYFPNQVRHEQQQKESRPYPQSSGEVHDNSPSPDPCKANANARHC